MTARKAPPAPSPPLPKVAAIPYPPAAIWREKEQGISFEFRGNTFVRHGAHVTRLTTDEAPPKTPGPATTDR